MSQTGEGPTEDSLLVECIVEACDWGGEETLFALTRRAIDVAADDFEFAPGTEVSILFTDDAHIRVLNAAWRGKDKPTNVLSFPAAPAIPGGVQPPMLGDIAIARETVLREADEQHKPFEHHLTHLLVHGFLHLIGYDHESDEEAEEMEALERQILEGLAIGDPYA